MIYTGKHDEFLNVKNISATDHLELITTAPSELSLLWFQEDGSELIIDGVHHHFQKDDIVAFTEFHQVSIVQISAARLLKWNKHFYCIINHDSEVGCRGILFYGAAQLPTFHANEEDAQILNTVWQMLIQEMRSHDELQEEMLQMMLKRILILCTRIYRNSTELSQLDNQQSDILRDYNFLVEQHFKEKHTVAEYAELLYKSPKTLSNLFKKLGTKTPLQYIQDRKILEARRLLSYSQLSVTEIGYELGFGDVQSFSRFFKKKAGISPADYKSSEVGKNG